MKKHILRAYITIYGGGRPLQVVGGCGGLFELWAWHAGPVWQPGFRPDCWVLLANVVGTPTTCLSVQGNNMSGQLSLVLHTMGTTISGVFHSDVEDFWEG